MEEQISNHIQTPYLISILITQNGYSFFVLNTKEQKVEDYQEDLSVQIDANWLWDKIENQLKETWQEKYKDATIQLCYHHSYFAVVPSEIFNEELKTDYLKFNSKLYNNDSISCEVNTDLKLHIPFVPYVNIHNGLLDFYESVDFTHSLHLSIKWAFQLSEKQAGEFAYIFMQKNSFDLVIIKYGKLHLANYFEYETAEDLVYYALFAIEQTQCNRERINLSVIGNLSDVHPIFKYLYRYVAHVELTTLKDLSLDTLLEHEEDKEIESFFNNHPLLAIQLCESFQEN